MEMRMDRFMPEPPKVEKTPEMKSATGMSAEEFDGLLESMTEGSHKGERDIRGIVDELSMQIAQAFEARGVDMGEDERDELMRRAEALEKLRPAVYDDHGSRVD